MLCKGHLPMPGLGVALTTSTHIPLTRTQAPTAPNHKGEARDSTPGAQEEEANSRAKSGPQRRLHGGGNIGSGPRRMVVFSPSGGGCSMQRFRGILQMPPKSASPPMYSPGHMGTELAYQLTQDAAVSFGRTELTPNISMYLTCAIEYKSHLFSQDKMWSFCESGGCFYSQ